MPAAGKGDRRSSVRARSFGIGRSLCPGRYFPFNEMMSVVPTVIRRFGIKLADGRAWEVLKMDVRSSSMCRGLYMTCRSRLTCDQISKRFIGNAVSAIGRSLRRGFFYMLASLSRINNLAFSFIYVHMSCQRTSESISAELKTIRCCNPISALQYCLSLWSLNSNTQKDSTQN